MFCTSKDSTTSIASSVSHVRSICKSFGSAIVNDCACTRNPITSQYNPVIINFCGAMTTTLIRKIRSISNAAVGMYEFCSKSADGLWYPTSCNQNLTSFFYISLKPRPCTLFCRLNSKYLGALEHQLLKPSTNHKKTDA